MKELNGRRSEEESPGNNGKMAFCPGAMFFCRSVRAANAGKKERVRIWAASVPNLTPGRHSDREIHKRPCVSVLAPPWRRDTWSIEQVHRQLIERPAVKAY